MRLLGVIEGEDQLEGGEKQRNDRLLAIATASHRYESMRSIDEIPKQLFDQMQEFFVTHPRLLGGKIYNLLGPKGPKKRPGSSIRRGRTFESKRS